MAASSTALLADIGGTNIRLALAGEPGAFAHYKVSDFDGPQAAIDTFLRAHGATPPRAAALAVAGPVTGDEIALTNHPWRFSQSGLRAHLGVERFLAVNDLVAAIAAIPFLNQSAQKVLHPGETTPGVPRIMLAAGTGLGAALLVPTGEEMPAFLALAGEGGHVTLAARNDFESALLDRARADDDHVSAEKLVSGFGLPRLYRLIAAHTGHAAEDLTAGQIADAAMAGDTLAEGTLAQFALFLGTVAGNLVLSTGAYGGVYLGGGILPRWGRHFRADLFREAMISKGRKRELLEPVPITLVTEAVPALIGLEALMRGTVALPSRP